MRYVGVDLAWGERARSGLATLDAEGRLIHSCSVVTDDEIAKHFELTAPGGVVAAVDAPLVVANEAGRRPCEALVGQLFGRFGAGAYPANRGNQHFVNPRGARLARRLELNIDPAARPEAVGRTCIEVYPHPAMVSLFSLDYVIPYKGKRGRDLDFLKAAYRRLLDHMESTCGERLALTTSPRWRDIRRVAESAARKSELDRLEDEIDAIFCAFLAWLWGNAPHTLIVLGDLESGYIVTPQPPDPDTPAGRPRAKAMARNRGSLQLEADPLATAMRAAVPRLTVRESLELASIARSSGIRDDEPDVRRP